MKKSRLLLVTLMFLTMSFFIVGCGNDNEVEAPSFTFQKVTYSEVEKELNEVGFDNVSGEAVYSEDAGSQNYPIDSIAWIKANGKRYIMGLKYPKDTSFVVYYYSDDPSLPTAESVKSDEESSDESNVNVSNEDNSGNIEWKTITDTVTDANGYTFKVTYKISPWILASDTDELDSAWDAVGEGDALPTIEEFGLKKFSNNLYSGHPKRGGSTAGNFSFTMTDAYYCVGTVQIENVTSGWDITSGSPYGFTCGLTWHSAFDDDVSMIYTVGKTFYSHESDTNGDYVVVNASMKSNSWGPVSFAVLAPENVSPKYPEGQYAEYMTEGYFTASSGSGEEIHLGVIGLDGKYTPPE